MSTLNFLSDLRMSWPIIAKGLIDMMKKHGLFMDSKKYYGDVGLIHSYMYAQDCDQRDVYRAFLLYEPDWFELYMKNNSTWPDYHSAGYAREMVRYGRWDLFIRCYKFIQEFSLMYEEDRFIVRYVAMYFAEIVPDELIQAQEKNMDYQISVILEIFSHVNLCNVIREYLIFLI